MFSAFSFGFYCNFDLTRSIYLSEFYDDPNAVLPIFQKKKLERLSKLQL
jgi:hypothetical protein